MKEIYGMKPWYPKPVGMLLILGAVAACGPKLIADSPIEDTPANREIVGKVQQYRQAMEARDPDALLKLVSRNYFENGSTTDDPGDDYGYDTLVEKVLPKLKNNVKKVQFDIVLKKVSYEGDRAFAEFEYFSKFQFVEGGEERWVARNDFNRLEFIREDGTWKITAGL